MTPRISIIIPLYNKSNFIADTVNSVLNQTFIDYEIIIINDGSTDNSLDVVNSINDNRIQIYTTKNQGVSAARNYGISKARANYIAFLDGDDYWEATFLDSMHQLTIDYPKNHVFSSAAKMINGRRNMPLKYYAKPKDKVSTLNFFKSSLGFPILHPSSLIMSKHVVNTIGLFDETLYTTEDTDYWIRIGTKYKIVFLNVPLVTIRITKNGLTQSNRTYYKPLNYSKYLENCEKTPFMKEFLNKNMYSSALKYKLLNDKESYLYIRNLINLKALNMKQRIILNLPTVIFKKAVSLYRTLNKGKNYY
ncbi:glycosyltransferase family 2 protein [Hanstruepera flava]|uniref:glycosyltransferase family 2 protein n=1 Tax=Hanstruepera flava TaxID=2930218 RepID=UPI00202844F1|nr:glycosyltransferase family 2 protein [Hanstruepera flava]